MPKLIIEVSTLKQAAVFAEWYQCQGEQSADIWFDERGVKTPTSDCDRKGGCTETNRKEGTVTLYCK